MHEIIRPRESKVDADAAAADIRKNMQELLNAINTQGEVLLRRLIVRYPRSPEELTETGTLLESMFNKGFNPLYCGPKIFLDLQQAHQQGPTSVKKSVRRAWDAVPGLHDRVLDALVRGNPDGSPHLIPLNPKNRFFLEGDNLLHCHARQWPLPPHIMNGLEKIPDHWHQQSGHDHKTPAETLWGSLMYYLAHESFSPKPEEIERVIVFSDYLMAPLPRNQQARIYKDIAQELDRTELKGSKDKQRTVEDYLRPWLHMQLQSVQLNEHTPKAAPRSKSPRL